ncbi:MAG: hypothetical protein HYT80_05550 [Euryarchaeota archaeon]|nr:hypothetical protein [Euryarchaeota archaeon]
MTEGAPVDLLQDELVRFVTPATPTMTAAEAAARPDAPPAGARCARCNERPATKRCFQCERWVCKDDIWTMLGLCKDCATTADNRAAREGASRARPDLGIKWIEE